MSKVIAFPGTRLRYDLDYCIDCSRSIREGESYLEIPLRVAGGVVCKAVCNDCENHFIESLQLPVVVADVTAL